MNIHVCLAVLIIAEIAEPLQRHTVTTRPPDQSTANKIATEPTTNGGLLQQVSSKFSALSAMATKPDQTPSVASDSGTTPIADEASVTTGTAVWVHISRERLADYIERSVNRKKPVRDTIVGTPIVGESHTRGDVRLSLVPNDSNAVADIVFEGHVDALTTGHNGPAVMDYDSHSTFRAHKRLLVSESGLVTTPAVVEAPTELRPTSIRTNLPGLRGRIGQRIARRRVNESLAQATAEVADHTARDIRHDLDRKIDESVAAIQTNLKSQLASLKADSAAQPLVIRSRSSKDYVELALCDRQELAQPMQSFPLDDATQLAVRVNRSMLMKLASNPVISSKLAPILGTAFAGGVAASGDNIERERRSTNWTVAGDWISIDLRGGSLDAPRLAFEDNASGPQKK